MKKNQQIEILILVILAIILASYLSVVYLIKPVRENTRTIESQIDEKEKNVLQKYAEAKKYEKTGERLELLSEALKSYAGKFSAGSDEDACLEKVSVSVKDCKVTFASLTASEGQFRFSSFANGEDASSGAYADLSENEALKGSDLMKRDRFIAYYNELKASGGRMEKELQALTMTVEASGKYGDVLSFLQALTEKNENVVCNSMQLDIAENISLKAPSDPEARLEVSLTFLTLPSVETMTDVGNAEELPAYKLPADVADGSYRR